MTKRSRFCTDKAIANTLTSRSPSTMYSSERCATHHTCKNLKVVEEILHGAWYLQSRCSLNPLFELNTRLCCLKVCTIYIYYIKKALDNSHVHHVSDSARGCRFARWLQRSCLMFQEAMTNTPRGGREDYTTCDPKAPQRQWRQW